MRIIKDSGIQSNPRRSLCRWGLLLAWMVALSSLSMNAQRLCFPQFTGVPFTYQPPAVDGTFVTNFNGNVDRDTGWTHAYRYILSNGTTAPDGAVQAIQDSVGHFIYLSFQIKNDVSFDNEDSIVIGFNPDNTPPNTAGPNMQRIIIHPVVGGTGATNPAGNLAMGSIEYVKGYDPNTGWPPATTDPPFITAVARSAGVSPALSWDVQVKINSGGGGGGGLNLPGGDFGLYINLVRVANMGTDTQFTFPPNQPLKINIQNNEVLLEGDSLPATNLWGTGTLSTTCSGVSITSISGNHGSLISINQPNQFSVGLKNTGTKDATLVKATFQIANFGLPAPDDWLIPGHLHNNPIGGDPAGPATVSANGGTATLSTGLWSIGTNASIDPVNVPQNEHDYYNGRHECIRVSLDSGSPDTVFSEQSSWNNFDVGTTSEFTQDFAIGTRGYRFKEGQGPVQFDLNVIPRITLSCTDVCALLNNPDAGLSKLNLVVTGCRRTGQFLIIKKKKFENCESAGAFGFGLTHKGLVKDFTNQLVGEGLRGQGNSYQISIPPGKSAVLRTRVVSVPAGSPPSQCGKAKNPSVATGLLFFGLFGMGVITFSPKRRKK